jgi:hypothetical protein
MRLSNQFGHIGATKLKIMADKNEIIKELQGTIDVLKLRIEYLEKSRDGFLEDFVELIAGMSILQFIRGRRMIKKLKKL